MIVNFLFLFLFLKGDIALVNIYVKIVDELLRLDKCDIKLVVELRFIFCFYFRVKNYFTNIYIYICRGEIYKSTVDFWPRAKSSHDKKGKRGQKISSPILLSPVYFKRRLRRNVSSDTQIWAKCAPPPQ